ncbi:uncharacterized protein LOC130648986 isoform X2 [Hydractinia symbiolongicarpus]|uniref:uncharacterized protein LOC130648986 isoform X2 n=1 Tax=Hydractinia symbiolongicarpus TaxID=13093 RepID=UPI00254C3DCF|nr:uncharacterized protein LOC130648986 isoform X2 [Hydractinia symbiolongicarpus]
MKAEGIMQIFVLLISISSYAASTPIITDIAVHENYAYIFWQIPSFDSYTDARVEYSDGESKKNSTNKLNVFKKGSLLYVKSGTNYSARIQVFSGTKKSGWSPFKNFTTPGLSAIPSLSILNVTSSSVRISWKPLTKSDQRYVIKVQSAFTSKQIPINSTHYQFSGLQSGSKYNFGVNVVDSKTRQQSSLTKNDAPKNLRILPTPDWPSGKILLLCDATKSDGASSYEISVTNKKYLLHSRYVSCPLVTTPNINSDFVKVIVQSCIVNELLSETDYIIKVRIVYTKDIKGKWSHPIDVLIGEERHQLLITDKPNKPTSNATETRVYTQTKVTRHPTDTLHGKYREELEARLSLKKKTNILTGFLVALYVTVTKKG